MGDSAIQGVPALAGASGGVVSSVNTRTGAVVLTAADVGAGQLPAGVLLDSGIVIPSGADISGILGSSGSKAAAGNDARLSDARTPTAHATSHKSGGSDAITIDQFAAAAADVALGSHKITGLANGSAAQDAAAFGQIPVAGAVGGFAKIVRRTADSSALASQATPQADDTLLWAVGASDVWFFEAFLMFTAADNGGAAATADISYGWAVPTGGVMQWGYTVGSNTFAGFGASTTAGTPVTLQSAASTPTSGAAAVTLGMTLVGFYTGDGSHTGNVNLKWSQAVSNVSTLTLNKNSFLRLIRLA